MHLVVQKCVLYMSQYVLSCKSKPNVVTILSTIKFQTYAITNDALICPTETHRHITL